MQADEDRQRVEGNERNRNPEDQYLSDFRTMPQTTPIASATSDGGPSCSQFLRGHWPGGR